MKGIILENCDNQNEIVFKELKCKSKQSKCYKRNDQMQVKRSKMLIYVESSEYLNLIKKSIDII